MQPQLDPRVGNQRQKKLLQQLAQQAMQRKGYTSKIGRFSKTGVGRGAIGAIGGLRGASRAGVKLFGSLGAVTPRGLIDGPGAVRGGRAHIGIPGQQAAPLPRYEPGDTIPGMEPGSNPFVTGQPGGAGMGGIATSDPEHNAFLGGLSDVDPFGGFASRPQTSPSSPITISGGLVPLGNGIYYDPETGSIRGGGYPGSSGS